MVKSEALIDLNEFPDSSATETILFLFILGITIGEISKQRPETRDLETRDCCFPSLSLAPPPPPHYHHPSSNLILLSLCFFICWRGLILDFSPIRGITSPSAQNSLSSYLQFGAKTGPIDFINSWIIPSSSLRYGLLSKWRDGRTF